MIAPKWIGPAAKRIDPSAGRTRESASLAEQASGAGAHGVPASAASHALALRDPDVRDALEQLAELLATQILAEIRGTSGTIAAASGSGRGRALRS
jgi:hypothetical protein